MLHMRLPFYYISTLWVAAFISVVFIMKPLFGALNKSSTFKNTSLAVKDEVSGSLNAFTTVSLSGKSENAYTNSDLIFYDKTAFIRYFGNTYAEEELVVSYDKAGITDSGNTGKPLIRVSRKNISGKKAHSFSTDFYIGPVPKPKK
jgi:hypothetical protein